MYCDGEGAEWEKKESQGHNKHKSRNMNLCQREQETK